MEPEENKQGNGSDTWTFLLAIICMAAMTFLLFHKDISYSIPIPDYKEGQIFNICDAEEYDAKDKTGVGLHRVVITHTNKSAIFYTEVGGSTTFSRTPREFYEQINACK